jgi:hypothetical protein
MVVYGVQGRIWCHLWIRGRDHHDVYWAHRLHSRRPTMRDRAAKGLFDDDPLC